MLFIYWSSQVPENLPSSLLSQYIDLYLNYLGKFFHRLYILSCRYRYTIHEYWSSWHLSHIQEKKHCIRQCLEQRTYWLMKKILKGIYSGPNMWREEYSFLRDMSLFSSKNFSFFLHVISLNLPLAVASYIFFSFSSRFGGLLSYDSTIFLG